MNRHQRRQASRNEQKGSSPNVPEQHFFTHSVSSLQQQAVAKPALLVRLFAGVVLSKWVRNRVRHPAARSALALIAREVGKTDIAVELEN